MAFANSWRWGSQAHGVPTPLGSLTLYVPGLFGEGDDRKAWPPFLRRWLARAQKTPGPVAEYEARLLSLWGMPSGVGLAALARIGEGLVGDDRWWIRADPVYLAIHGDNLILTEADLTDVAREEITRLASSVRDLFVSEQGVLEVVAPDRWYLTLPTPPSFSGASLKEVLGRSIDNYLPDGDRRFWRARLNEVQMVLHQSQSDCHGGEGVGIRFNSVWFWGAGRAPVSYQGPYDAIITEDVLQIGIARVAGAHRHQGSYDIPTLATVGHVFVDLSALFVLMPGAQPVFDEQAFQAIMDTWLCPAGQALKAQKIEFLRLVADRGPVLTLRRADMGRWWQSWVSRA